MKVEIVDYTYKDTVARGDGRRRLIGQQLIGVYDQAVSFSTDVVPDIYRKAEASDGWIGLDTTLKRGDRVKVIPRDGAGSIVEVTDVSSHGFRVSPGVPDGDLFVYGREVRDFSQPWITTPYPCSTSRRPSRSSARRTPKSRPCGRRTRTCARVWKGWRPCSWSLAQMDARLLQTGSRPDRGSARRKRRHPVFRIRRGGSRCNILSAASAPRRCLPSAGSQRSQPPARRTPTKELTTSYGSAVVGDYGVLNNRWKGDQEQCINVTGSGFQIVSQKNSMPTNGPPASYPFIYIGCPLQQLLAPPQPADTGQVDRHGRKQHQVRLRQHRRDLRRLVRYLARPAAQEGRR